MATVPKDVKALEAKLREQGLAYPETTEDFPWGHRTLKVKGKAFIFISTEEGRLGLSVKLPLSGSAALTLPFTSPTGYGLGKSGWVSGDFPSGKLPPPALLKAWLDESYRAVAPKRVVAQLEGAKPAAPAKKSRGRKRNPKAL
jgi:predicted DNA-binding protein (MmcQ/YjbR family)